MIQEEFLKYIHENNTFATFLGVQVLEVKPGYAMGELKIQDHHKNAVGSVHGGCAFTLADTLGAVASSFGGTRMITLSGDFHFLSAAMDGSEKLIGKAREVKYGKKIQVYDLEISDDTGKLIAKGTFSYYNTGMPWEEVDGNMGESGQR